MVSNSSTQCHKATPHLCIREMLPHQVAQISALVMRTFARQVAGDFEPQGVAEFADYATAEAIAERQRSRHWTLVAMEGEELVGMIEMRDACHISLLFVSTLHQQRGIGAGLWREALARCLGENPGLSAITVNSAPSAQPFYSRLGFRPAGDRACVHGIVFYPMSYSVPLGKGTGKQ